MLIPAVILGTHSEVRKNAKAVIKKVNRGFSWLEAINTQGLLEINDFAFPISLENESNKSEKMFYFNIFFNEVEKHMTPLFEPEEIQQKEAFLKQKSFGDHVFSACLELPWGVIALSVSFWGVKNRMWMPENSEILTIEWYFEYEKMRRFLMKIGENWDLLTSIGQNYYGMPYQKHFFWELPTRFQFSLLNLGITKSKIDEVFGSVYEQMSLHPKTNISRAAITNLITEALEISKDFPSLGLQQVPT